MLKPELLILTFTAVSLGFFHTLVGPDHYLPFIVMAKVRKWSLKKTVLITLLCGAGHILSSVLLGFLGIALGTAVTRLEIIESFRGNIAAWLLIAFGLVYFTWGLRMALRSRPHKHWHDHDEDSHEHRHTHMQGHLHVHDQTGGANITPWVLFTIFVFGPCEPLIPILMYPAAKSSFFGMALVTALFGLATIMTMLAIVMVSCLGINFLPFGKLERYAHALAGAAIFFCGVAIQSLGL